MYFKINNEYCELMKYAIISDIHSDYYALLNVLNSINEQGVDEIV